jgi:hypothetical protein
MREARASSYGLLRWGACAVAALSSLVGSRSWADDIPLIPAIEAVYLTKFAPFVEWPSGAVAAGGRLIICVMNDDRIADAAALAITSSRATALTLVRRVAPSGPTGGCQILFIGSSDVATVRTALAALAAAPTLTVTAGADAGCEGVINFVVRDDHVRFEIDVSQAARHRLKISSKLLSVAVSVEP